LGIEKDFVYTGYVPDEDLILLYNAAHAFVLPYSYEAGASLTALEAQAAGLPVITVDTPGLRETTGNEALYMAEAEVPDMVEAMTRAAQDPEFRRGLSEGGLRFARQFSWRRTAAETLAVLEEAART
jgi:glycosyltransferase involved in cell wall biosynthesis